MHCPPAGYLDSYCIFTVSSRRIEGPGLVNINMGPPPVKYVRHIKYYLSCNLIFKLEFPELYLVTLEGIKWVTTSCLCVYVDK
jgi:hypothetical protein